MILGSCDFLQYPGAFTGIWASRSFGPLDAEAFLFENYGPLQSQLAGGGERFVGGTARWNAWAGGVLETLSAYYMEGTNDGDVVRFAEDSWLGLEGVGHLPLGLQWEAQFAHRQAAAASDVSAYRVVLTHQFAEPLGGFVRSIAVTRTDSEGKLDINPADFNSAGLLHEYAGIWRSDLDTNQLAVAFTPGGEIDCTLTALTLDHDGATGGGINQQLGHTEFDLLVGKMVKPGVHCGAGYAIDNQERQVGYLQLTAYF